MKDSWSEKSPGEMNKMDDNFTETLDEFMGSALVTWVHLFEDMVGDEGQNYMEVNSNSQNALNAQYLQLTNGIYLNEVMRIIDPNPNVEQIYHNVRDDKILRVQNFSILNRHLRSYYQENLQQLVLMPLPNVAVLGRDPLTEGALEELRRLLLLLLGCAVQCETKQTFIQQIQSLNIETQAELALCIQEVTQDPSAVLPLHYGEMCALDGLELQTLLGSLARQIQSLLAQRDMHLERIAELSVQCESVSSPTTPPTGPWHNAPEGLSIQLADSKAKLRRLKQELEDKEDQLIDYKREIQTMEVELKKLQCENRALQGEVRVSRSLRDEVDCLRERANKADQLQTELKTCTHRLRSMELYRTQLKEQQQYCASLQENKALLEEQLDDTRVRCSALRELEKDNLLLRQKLMDLEAERDVERQRVDELLEMNMRLQMDLKRPSLSVDVTQRVTHPHVLYSELESDEELQEPKTPEHHGEHKPLSVEVNEASSLRLLGAENENAELRRRLERLQAEQEALQTQSPEVTETLQRQTDKLKQLEEEHQNTLKEFQNLKNENSSLKRSLEELEKIRLQEKQERSPGEVEKEIPRGECEGKDMGKEEEADKREKRKQEMIRAQREDGEGEEVLLKEKKEETENDPETKERGEAEGQKWTGTGKDKPESMTTKEESKSDDEMPMQKGKQEENAREIETEVNKLHREIHALTTQLQQAVEEADQQTNLVQELHSKLGEQTKKTRETEQKLALLEAESQRLKKAAESLTEARKQIEILQCESMHQEEELMRLRSQAELQKMEAAVIPQLEGERAALERERETLKATIDSLRASVRKGDQVELNNQTLKAELERLGRNLDSARRREEELEAELKESSFEIDSLSKRRDEAMLEVSRLEQEKEACQSELDCQRREQRQKEREMARLRQQLESTTSALEHANQRACSLELQHRRVCQELKELKETVVQLEELQKENQQMNAQNAENSTQITSLTQELASERVQSQKLTTQVAELNQSLEELDGKLKMANSQLTQLQTEHARVVSEVAAFSCNSGTEVAEDSKSNRQSPMQRENQEDPHISSKDRIAESQTSENAAIVASSEDTQSLEDNKKQSPKINSESQHHASVKLLSMEKENAMLQQERQTLLSQLAQSQTVCTHLREQLDSLQRHSISLQESCSKLQDLNTKLQVEQTSLSSQNASVLARCREIEVRCATLEADSKVWQKEKEESAVRCESLRRDHERLTALQQRQEAELEELLAKHSQLKSSGRGLEAQYRELEARHKELMKSKAKLEEAEEEIQAERERMERAVQEQTVREKELERLRMENERYVNQQKEWVQVQSELLAQVSVLRSEMSTAQIERTKLEGELNMLKEQNQQLDLNNVRLNSQHQLLTQLKGNMEEENRHLVEQNQSLAKENRALLERSLESRDQHHNQQREYLDKLNELRREKQKLVEKIMDQYRVLEPGMSATKQPKKSNWIADRMKKLIKPKGGKEGRAHFITIGSMDILEEPGDSVPSSPLTSAHSQEQDPSSAPASPSTLRRVSSQGDPDEPSKVVLRSARRKLGSSRHGWGLGKGREGGVSQSFSPGDRRSRPLQRLNPPSSALWEKDHDGSPTPSEEGRGESEENTTSEHSDSRVSSGAEDFHSSFDKPQD
ncbi:coiled-coil domain containing 88A isoform X2 [Silurus meridionalis]|uniref:coiled-coil domain containing 88A isoform X2 n=1 Tax=Silurus meridionalis TaxID=175797 RepID=UPI001EECD6E5|nr:coiled-coil domain containing 88A isoform X2 [Silurus meridionalis]